MVVVIRKKEREFMLTLPDKWEFIGNNKPYLLHGNQLHQEYYTITNQEIQPIFSPDFRRIASFLAKLKKEKGSLLAAAPCPYPSALPIAPRFSFSVLKKAPMSVCESRVDGEPSGDCKGRSLCPSESAIPLMLIVACGNQCQGYYGVTVGTTVRIPERKEIILMSEKRISHCQGRGSLTHNNRKFNAKNVDDTRTKDNIVFVQQPIEEAYEHLFGAAVERYNARQKRADRKIKTSYYEHTFKRKISQTVVTAADKRKSFSEDVVQIGDMKNTGVGTPDAEIATACLTEYMQGFQQRNPNFYVFNAVLHLDEATPHLHIDYIPVGHYKMGVDTQNGIAQALKEMGYGSGKDTISRWREAECKVLTEICARHGIQIAAPEKSRGSLTVEQYKEYAKITEQVEEKKEEATRLDEQVESADRLLKHREELRSQVEVVIDELDEQFQEKNAAVEHLDEEIAEKSSALTQTTDALADKQTLLETSARKAAKLKSIDEIETGKTMFGGKVTLSKEDYGMLTDLSKKQIAAENRESELTDEIARLKKENEEAAKKNAAQKQEILELLPQKDALRRAENELRSLKAKFQKVLEFIENLNLTQKLQEFLKQRARGVKR